MAISILDERDSSSAENDKIVLTLAEETSLDLTRLEWDDADRLPNGVRYEMMMAERTGNAIRAVYRMLKRDAAHAQDAARNPSQVEYHRLDEATVSGLHDALEVLFSRQATMFDWIRRFFTTPQSSEHVEGA